MNVTDVFILLLGSYFIIRGIFRGFSGEVFSLISIFGGFYCALSFYPPIADLLTKYLGINTLASSAFSMLLIFMLIFAVFTWIDKGIKKFLKGTRMSWIDKFFGALAGLVKIYVVALLLLLMGMILMPMAGDTWVRDSKTLIATAKTWPIVYPLLDEAGLIPDLAAIQQEAKDYIMRQAERRLFGPAEGEKGSLPQLESGEMLLSADSVPSLDVLVSGDIADRYEEATGENHPLLELFQGIGN